MGSLDLLQGSECVPRGRTWRRPNSEALAVVSDAGALWMRSRVGLASLVCSAEAVL